MFACDLLSLFIQSCNVPVINWLTAFRRIAVTVIEHMPTTGIAAGIHTVVLRKHVLVTTFVLDSNNFRAIKYY